ncbi:midnolin-A [Austrofundulus limnaeus]|uniref:Midnolin-A n=1 Tax=Austrofundulus limnaeus TaxID=52670 RepID=A0A2I4CA31_AUSLI|nr:PREDICTED: midnolin [Austrofundulus limnaeus]
MMLLVAEEAGPCIGLSITTTTGSPVELTVPRGETEDSLRTRISQKLSLQTDRMVLVHKDRLLTAGKLLDQGVRDGSRLTLVPAIETGLVCLNPKERKIMDMLESLTETQIDDFLSGRSPLTFSVGSGAHTMCVQLQLSQDMKTLQEDEDSRTPQTSRCTSDSPDSSCSGPFTPQTSSPSSLSRPSPHCNPHRPRTSFKSPKSVPPGSCPSSPPRFVQPPQPVCSAKPTGSTADPLTEADLSKQPGAVIESFVTHSPGVLSGTFSGTLASCGQNHIHHPRRGISIILQILNDLLRAAYHHQEASTPPPLHRCTTSKLPFSHLPPKDRPPRPQRTGLRGDKRQLLPSSSSSSSSEENKSLQGKLERLQLLMHQRRLRRQTRRCSYLHKATRPNLQRHNCS